MLSLIICSKHSMIDEFLKRNISETIGVDYEIVHIDNSKNQYTISKAYNVGVQRAKGDYLCFMHEDVIYHSQGWGGVVQKCLEQDFVGALGVVGSTIIHDRIDWRFLEHQHSGIIQGAFSVEKNPLYYWTHTPFKQEKMPICQVATLDGVWICIRKELFDKKQLCFDEKTYHGFHQYDNDICMQVNQLGKGVFLTTDVLLEHKSEGVFSVEYRENMDLFLRKWQKCLPMVKGIHIEKKEIDSLLKDAEHDVEERLAQDAMMVNLRERLKKEGSQNFTKDEKKMMEKTAYYSRKHYIKMTDMPSSEVWGLVWDYCCQPWATRRTKLLYKFCWYRVLKRKKGSRG